MRQESYVIRIYRREKRYPQEIVGTVEAPESGRQASFRGFTELFAILTHPRRYLRAAMARPE